MSCRHQPNFKFKQMFVRNPEYVCKHCNRRIELKVNFRTAIRAMNALFIMIILFRAFRNNDPDPSVESFIINMAILFGAAFLYVMVLVLIIKYGPYEEVDVPEESEIEAEVLTSEQTEHIDAEQQDQEDTPKVASDDEAFTEEQKQLMEMYAAYEKLAEEKKQQNADKPEKISKPLPEAPECNHEPIPSWKNYIPSKMDFVCRHCGEQIGFSMQRKRSINLIFLAVMAIILMPNFMNDKINFWQYLLITLGALIVATVIQIFFVKRWPMEIKKTQ